MGTSAKTVVKVGKRKIELSNLNKVLFPEDGIIKAQIIEYYFALAPTVLAHLKGRPISVVRFPDGLSGESFFQKDRPKWAPEWIAHQVLGEEQKDYVIANEEATLVWLANLACIELHQMGVRAPHFDKPDYIVYDFDPPEGFGFQKVVEVAFEFKEHLQTLGYSPFVKTSGRKGLHVVTPIEPRWTVEQVFEAAKLVAQPFVEKQGSAMTLQIKKEHRKGKILLDIYRNRQSQTIVSAYSLRGSPGAPVSTPLRWEELEGIEKPGMFNIQTVRERVTRTGDPWEAMGGYATVLHTEKKVKPAAVKQLPPARKYKTPGQLADYAKKRRFEKTSEPAGAPGSGAGNSFVVHRHHASRLHYDLRLEQDGVLKSWAVPKGLPPRPGIMRLAVNVEDHPVEYVNFEGEIPKGEYGGGMMWKFAQGRYEITKQKKGGFYFRLHSRELNGEYRIHNTKENQWLLERVDEPQVDWLRAKIEPMLARAADKPPGSADYFYEVKWDGIRALISLDEGEVKIRGRNGLDLTMQFPELNVANAFRASCGVFDAEIVCLEADGKPNFANVIHRMQQRAESGIKAARGRCPAVCYLFDCLFLDGRSIMQEPLTRRREWLKDVVRAGPVYRVSETMDDGPGLYEAVKGMGLEGILCKQRTSTYQPGKRSDSWLKVKARQTVECVIIGFSRGKGDREKYFGALHLAQREGEGLKYVGKVGSGFTERSLAEVNEEIKKLNRVKRPVKEKPEDDAQAVWVEPKLVCEVQYATITKDGILREPVFLRLRKDLTLEV